MKTPVELNSLLSNFFCYTPGLLYHLIRRDYGRLANEAFTSICIVSFKQKLNGLKITNCTDKSETNINPKPKENTTAGLKTCHFICLKKAFCSRF